MSWLTLVIATQIERLLNSCESGGAIGVVAGPIFTIAGPIYVIIVGCHSSLEYDQR
jgi:hypothetical protein